MESGSTTSWQIKGENVEVVTDFLFLGSKITVDGDCSHEIRRRFLHGRWVMTNLDSVLKSRDITLLTKVSIVKAMVFPVVILWLWELDHKEGRMPKNWCLWAVVLEKTPKSPLDGKEIKPVNLKGDQPWTFTGRTDAKDETPVFWSSHPLQHSCLENPTDGGARGATVHGVAKSRTRLSDFTHSLNEYVSMLFSQFVHPLLPLLCIQVFSRSASLLLPCK